MTDAKTTIQQLKNLLKKFYAERGWGRHHAPKNLAVSIVLEAAELLEHYQWDDYTIRERQEIERELADVVIYCLAFAMATDIDVAKVIDDKLKLNAKKYPVHLFRGTNDEPEIYRKIKKKYRKS